MTRPPLRRLTDEEIDRQIEAANLRHEEYRRAGLLATQVQYDERARRFVLELTNGYSLARKLFFEIGGFTADSYIEELGSTVSEALLATHASFLPQIGPLLDSGVIKGLVHITGGGFLENIPRILPDGVSVEIQRGSWTELPIFGMMQRLGNVETHEMFRTFNMGVGMIVVCNIHDAETIGVAIPGILKIGQISTGNKEVNIIE